MSILQEKTTTPPGCSRIHLMFSAQRLIVCCICCCLATCSFCFNVRQIVYPVNVHIPPPFTNDFYTFWWCTRSTMMWGTQKNEPIIETGQLCLLLVAHKLLMLEKFGLKLKRKAKNRTTAAETINRCQDFNDLYLNTHFVIHWAWAPITCLLLHIVGWMHLFKNTL